MKKICFIYPEDSTTVFLEYILLFICDNGKSENIEILRVACNEESHRSCIDIISQSDSGQLYVFLGHGTSYCLSGSRSESYTKEVFIDEYNLSIFKNKNVLFLSCRSVEFISDFYAKSGINSAIGFGDLPTDPRDAEELQRIDAFYDDVTNEIIDFYKSSITEIIGSSLLDSLVFDLTMKDLYFRIRLRINKLMSKIILDNNTANNQILTRLLFIMKNEMKMIGNIEATVYKTTKKESFIQ